MAGRLEERVIQSLSAVENAKKQGDDIKISNGWLAMYAADLAQRFTGKS